MNSRGPVGLGRKAVRAASGGVLVIVALLVLLFMQGPGTGSSDPQSSAESESAGSEALVSAAGDVGPTTSRPADDEEDHESADQDPTAFVGDTLVVLIDEHDYFINVPADRTDAWQPVELSRLIELAQQATGDSNGIRVRIQKRSTARASAEHRIRSELQQAGIGMDAIFESAELVDE